MDGTCLPDNPWEAKEANPPFYNVGTVSQPFIFILTLAGYTPNAGLGLTG